MCLLPNWWKSASTKPPWKPCATVPAMPSSPWPSCRKKKLDEVEEELKTLNGIDQDMLRDLAQAGITTRDSLAELSTDELIEITGVSEEEAKTVILRPRTLVCRNTGIRRPETYE